jgi:hypothetical protein
LRNKKFDNKSRHSWILVQDWFILTVTGWYTVNDFVDIPSKKETLESEWTEAIVTRENNNVFYK